MPGGVPHWVLTTSNAICVGRHFYGKSTIRSSVIANVQAFLYRSTVTNQELAETRTLLYQMMVFWSMRLDITDVDGVFPFNARRPFLKGILIGAHIPDLSSEVEFFDFLYLGVFIILSTAYDDRFYNGRKPPPHVSKEADNARGHFRSALLRFSRRFVIILEGEAVGFWYVVDRMLGEFAAASVVLAKVIYESEGHESDDEVDDRIPRSALAQRIEDILQALHPEVLPYYSRCLNRCHKDFIWTGPNLQILPRSETVDLLVSQLAEGELLDLPSYQIYTEDVDAAPPIQSDAVDQTGKRRGDSLEGGEARKRNRRS